MKYHIEFVRKRKEFNETYNTYHLIYNCFEYWKAHNKFILLSKNYPSEKIIFTCSNKFDAHNIASFN